MNIGKPVLWLALALSALFTVSAAASYFAFPAESVRIDNPQARVTMTPEEATAAQNPSGFQMLVSYTDAGFVPSAADMKIGNTVRFYNGSSGKLWIASDASVGALYPGMSNGCGSSAFDSCYALNNGEYYEFTFTLEGEWGFSNTLDKSKAGIVRVSKK